MTRRNRRADYGRILIVGTGRAGVAAAEELRRQGYPGEIAMVGAEKEGPYDRPSCSKGILTGHKRPQDTRMPFHDEDLTWYLGRRAVDLDPDNRRVETDTGESFAYDGLVIATGSSPSMPKWAAEPGVHLLHNLEHAWSLRRALRDAERVIIVGGGITGSEVASAVRSMARNCVVIDSKQQVMVRALGEEVGNHVTDVMRGEGVDFRLGHRVASANRFRDGWMVQLDDGENLVGDVVVATTGGRPDTAWLENAGIDLSKGVVCDESLRVVGLEDVVACGAVATWPNLRYGPQLRKAEHWISSLEQGRGAARTLLAEDGDPGPVTVIPRFWTEQWGLRIQVCGELVPDGEVSISEMKRHRRDTARAGVVVGYHRDDRLVGLVSVNAAHAFTSLARAMIATPLPAVQATPMPLQTDKPLNTEIAEPARRRLASVA
ncbi:ferredoxin reductase [Asanoa ishikariensis]|uniref:Reductase C-terminal n=1 Tax=Asanoa ishikariensis TaxID=137265 RepID=A0A1H3S414_9ACTN|nr:FAD-dependent oxidoreductase [Asanoa ishikariensis]GIF66527.1 ferredoxin reductase [Asanoa ishikariensis]SDZ32550.1 Reductase C-terminal [Asanoa ishikariensis]